MTHLAPSPTRAARGFSLIEVMAALVIFMFGALGVLALFVGGLSLHRDAQRKAMIAIASDEVRAAVETRLAKTIEQGQDADLTPIDGVPVAGHPGYFYSADLAVDPVTGAGDGILARVFVYALDVGKQRGAEFTVFVRNGARPEDQIRRALGLGAPTVATPESGQK
jgi:prepilin-type N-terminal cleavage/methylation domain-containing protein